MSVFGIDFGNLYSTVSVARRRGVDVLINEVSKRETSTFVSFGRPDEGRMIGEKGKDMKIRNYKNTATHLKRMIGVKYDSPEWQEEMKHCNFVCAKGADGYVEVHVEFDGNKVGFKPEQLIAMMLGKLRSYANREAAELVKDCVIACPPYFSAFQRQRLMQATEVAGLNCLSLISEGTAVALQYGIFKQDTMPEKEEDGITVLFCDVGHSATYITSVKFWRGNLQVLAHHYDVHLGCRDFDYLLSEYFNEAIMKKYKMDVFTNHKAKLRLVDSCEKLRYLMSANPEVTLNIECLMNDVDVSLPYSRKDFDELAAPLWERMEKLVARASASLDSVHAVELVGGGSYMPRVKGILTDAFSKFGKPVTTTLNASEAVAKGCGIMGAMLSPRYHVKEFIVEDALVHPIDFAFDNVTKELFFQNHNFPKTRELKFPDRQGPFELRTFYKAPCPEVMVANGTLELGQWVFEVPAGAPQELKVKVELSKCGLVRIKSAYITEEYQVEQKAEKKKEEKKEGDDKKDGEEKKEEAETVMVTKTRDVEVTVVPKILSIGLSDAEVAEFAKLEAKMEAQDRELTETMEAKNALEGYAYEFRSKAEEGGVLFSFMPEAERETFKKACDAAVDWLYGEGEAVSKGEYISKLNELRRPGDAATARMRLREDLPPVFATLQKTLLEQMDKASNLIKGETHIDKTKLQEIVTKAEETKEWLKQQKLAFEASPTDKDFDISEAKITNKTKEVVNFAKPIFDTPKPAPPPEKPAEKKEDDKMDVDKEPGAESPKAESK